MADQVSKSLTTIGWVLIGIIGIVLAGALLFVVAMFFAAPAIAVWLKLLVAVVLIGAGLLFFLAIRNFMKDTEIDKLLFYVVTRDHVKDVKSDTYKYIEL